MKHIRNFEGFKEKRKNQVVSENVTNYYYKLGKSCNKSIFEMELVSEGYSIEFVNSINESLQLCKNKIIDNNINLDLLNLMKNDYLNKTNYNDYINSNIENKDKYKDIYTKIFDIQKEQKNMEKNYDYLLSLL